MDAVTVTTTDAADIERLLACRPLREDFDRVIVVDNASEDGSREIAERGGAAVVRRQQRGGYGACINAGAREARGEFLAVVNPDILFHQGRVVDRLMGHFDDPRVAIVAPALELPDGRLQDSAREFPTPLDLVLRRFSDPERGAVREAGDVHWTVGAFWLVRRSAWDAVGGFDEAYFLYFDDVDLCSRLRRAGWKVRFDPSIRVLHNFGAASRLGLLAWATRHHIRSATRFFVRNPRHVLTRRP
jgi:GT2 family glycosyltransferase